MNRKALSSEFIFQLFSLVIAILLVHAVYVTVVRPNASQALIEEAVLINENPDYVPDRNLYVVVKDLEQEACFVLMLWAIALMAFKAREIYRERLLFDRHLIPVDTMTRILPQDTREYARAIESLDTPDQERLLPKTLLAALNRFRSTHSVQDVAQTIRAICEAESDRLDSELSMIRYIAWAIPSIGFLGTVRGIGQALGQAHQAAQGDIAGVTQSLGVAFNSTFVALLISILIMFLMHQLQLAQERTTQETEQYCDQRLLRFLES
ncbi:MAG: MotA/TolQ/ExbB proton channel family protein [Pseudomonadales bacterium]